MNYKTKKVFPRISTRCRNHKSVPPRFTLYIISHIMLLLIDVQETVVVLGQMTDASCLKPFGELFTTLVAFV